jgi:hypothetical protein
MHDLVSLECVRACPLRAVGHQWVVTYALLMVIQNPVPQVRLELTTSAFLTAGTDYKYGALTDCATGARTCIELPKMGTDTCTVPERTHLLQVPPCACLQRERKGQTREQRQHVPMATKHSNLFKKNIAGLASGVYAN